MEIKIKYIYKIYFLFLIKQMHKGKALTSIYSNKAKKRNKTIANYRKSKFEENMPVRESLELNKDFQNLEKERNKKKNDNLNEANKEGEKNYKSIRLTYKSKNDKLMDCDEKLSINKKYDPLTNGYYGNIKANKKSPVDSKNKQNEDTIEDTKEKKNNNKNTENNKYNIIIFKNKIEENEEMKNKKEENAPEKKEKTLKDTMNVEQKLFQKNREKTKIEEETKNEIKRRGVIGRERENETEKGKDIEKGKNRKEIIEKENEVERDRGIKREKEKYNETEVIKYEKIYYENENKEKKDKEFYKNKKNNNYYNLKLGFTNLGQTCYMNSFLQIIIHVPNFINTLLNYRGIFKKNSLTSLLINIADDPTDYNLSKFKNAMGSVNEQYFYYGQNDSQEFGAELLINLMNESIDAELILGDFQLENFKYNSKNKEIAKIKKNYLEQLLTGEDSEYECEFKFETIISQTFQYFESETIYKKNEITHINYYGNFINQLSLYYKNGYYYKNVDLVDLLKSKYSKNKKLIKLPKVFIITLCRAVMGQALLKTKVKYPDCLDLKEFLDKDFGDYTGCTKYSLYAVNVCSGYSKEYGHYYSFIKIDNNWYSFNDSNVEFALKTSNYYNSSEAYGLFYIRQDFK